MHTLHSHPEIMKATCEIRQTSYNRNQTQSTTTSTATAVLRPLYRSVLLDFTANMPLVMAIAYTHTHICLTVLFPGLTLPGEPVPERQNQSGFY